MPMLPMPSTTPLAGLLAVVVLVLPPLPAAPAAQDADSPDARVAPPAAAPGAEVGFDDPRVKAIETKLRCTCGCNLDIWTCQRQMQCGVSPPMSAEVRERLAGGADAEAILDAFVAREGQDILMAPPKEGFNLLGYLLPFVALALGAGIVVVVVRRWSREAAAEAEATSAAGVSDDGLRRVEAELARLEDEELL